MSDERTMTGPLGDAYGNARARLTAARSLTPEAVGLIFADFHLENTDVSRLVKARSTMARQRLVDADAYEDAREKGIDADKFMETVLSWLCLEMLLTGLLAGRPGDGA